MISDERRTLADLLDGLSIQQRRTRSLCDEWTVHEVGAHLLSPLEVTTFEFLTTMLLSGGRFDRANVRLTSRRAERSTEDIARGLRERADSTFSPPGSGLEAPLTDLLVHGLDIRRPLGLDAPVLQQRYRIALDFLTGRPGRTFVPKGRLARLRLAATDMDWDHGNGAVTEGTAEDLLLAMTGRVSGADELQGPGSVMLRDRLKPKR